MAQKANPNSTRILLHHYWFSQWYTKPSRNTYSNQYLQDHLIKKYIIAFFRKNKVHLVVDQAYFKKKNNILYIYIPIAWLEFLRTPAWQIEIAKELFFQEKNTFMGIDLFQKNIMNEGRNNIKEINPKMHFFFKKQLVNNYFIYKIKKNEQKTEKKKMFLPNIPKKKFFKDKKEEVRRQKALRYLKSIKKKQIKSRMIVFKRKSSLNSFIKYIRSEILMKKYKYQSTLYDLENYLNFYRRTYSMITLLQKITNITKLKTQLVLIPHHIIEKDSFLLNKWICILLKKKYIKTFKIIKKEILKRHFNIPSRKTPHNFINAAEYISGMYLSYSGRVGRMLRKKFFTIKNISMPRSTFSGPISFSKRTDYTIKGAFGLKVALFYNYEKIYNIRLSKKQKIII